MFEASIPLRSVASRVSDTFLKAVRYKACVRDRADAIKRVGDAMDAAGGMVVGERHGIYSHADFMTDFIPHAAAKGADRLYVEMFHVRNQRYIDDWQDRGDASGLIWLMDKSPAHAEFMWPHFWEVLKTAKAYGLRVITVEPDGTPDNLYPGTLFLYRHCMWDNVIYADQRSKGQERPFVMYCGKNHLSRRASNCSPIQDILNVTAVDLNEGSFALIPPFFKKSPAYMALPLAPHQTPITPLQMHHRGQIGGKGISPS